MTIPDTLDINLIDEGERGRTEYNRVEELSQSIHDNGLIQPIVLVPLVVGATCVDEHGAGFYGLNAGGRRLRALRMLGHTKLYHATTSDPERPGFVLKGEDQATPLKRLFTEIAENLDREDLPWRDQVSLLTKAWRLAKHQSDANGERILMRDFGASLGISYADLQAAVIVHDDVIAHPERYKDCTGIRNAYSIKLKCEADELTKIQALRSIKTTPLLDTTIVLKDISTVPAQNGPAPEISIPLTNNYFNHNSIEWMENTTESQFDHIITDPDYGVAIERLEASVADASSGVHQTTVEDSLADMARFITQSWRLLRPQGFLVFWYDLDHHEKLQRLATSVGFAVQRWPLIWHKIDYRSNAAPQFNFTKNIEYAMICRKPNAVLAKAQNSSVYQCGTGGVVRELGHPFAKPFELWYWIFNAVALKGQNFYDPFCGRGSSAIAGVKWGLRPMGSETNSDHYHGLLHNLQTFYRKELGPNVSFT